MKRGVRIRGVRIICSVFQKHWQVRASAGRGSPTIEGYAEWPLPEGILLPSYTKENIADMKGFQDLLKLTLGTAGISSGDISLSIPDQVVKVSFIEAKGVPKNRNEVLKFIKWKSKRSLPYDPEVAKIDYQLMGDTAMAVFIKDDIVSNYEDALRSMSFRPKSVSTPSLNLFNLFSGKFGGHKEFALISVMEDHFAVTIVRDDYIDFYRSTDVGYGDDRLMQEINSSILFYANENPDVILKTVFLYTGTGDSKVLATHLSDSTGMKVETLRLAEIIKGPADVDVEPYGPAVAAALGSR